MPDNITTKIPSGATDGPPVRTLEDASSVQWAVGVTAYATTVGTPDVLTIPVAAALADDTANPTTLLSGACLLVFDGTTWDRARGSSADGLLVNLGANNDVTVTGTVAATQSGTWSVTGEVDVTPASPSATAYLPVRLTDGTSFYSASGGGSTQQYAEDSAHTTGDLGTVALAVRKDTAAALAGADGDYSVLLTDASGRLHVNVGNTVAVSDGAGSLTVDAPVGTPVFVRLSDGSSAISALPVTDNGGSLTVDGSVSISGSVTVDSELTTADLDTGAGSDVRAVVGLVFGASGGGTLVSTTNPLPVGDNGGSLTVDNAGTFAVQATQAGTWNVRAQDGAGNALTSKAPGSERALSVAIVDGSGAHVTSFGGGTQYTEGDTDASITGTALLWEDTSDTLRAVSAAKPLPVNIIGGAGSGGTAIADGAEFTPDTTSLTPVGGYLDDTSPATVTEGDAAACRITTNRALHVNLRDASGNEVSVGGGTQYDEDTAHVSGDKLTLAGAVRRDSATSGTSADGDRATLNVDANGRLYVANDTHAVTQSGGWTVTANAGTNLNTSSLALESGGNLATIAGAVRAEDAASGDGHTGIGLLAVRKATPANTSGADGDYEFLQVSAGRLWASATIDAALPAGSNVIGAVTQSGTWNVGTVTTVSTVTAVSDASVQGKAAHDAAASGNPVLAGLEGRRARATAVSADGDAVRATADRYGRQAVIGVPLTIAAVDATSSGDTDIVAAASIGSGNRCKLLRVEASNTHASTALTVGLKSASLNGGTVFGKKYVPAAGGLAVWVFPGGYLEGGDNEAVKINLSGAGAISVTAYYELVAS